MGFIFGCIVWILGGIAAFHLGGMIMKMLEPTFGGFSFVIVVILWLVFMTFLAGIIDLDFPVVR